MLFLIALFSGVFVFSSVYFALSFLSEKKEIKKRKIFDILAERIEKIQGDKFRDLVERTLTPHFEEQGIIFLERPYRVFVKGEVLGLTLFVFSTFVFNSLFFGILSFFFGFFAPYLDLRSKRKRLEKEIVKGLPFFLDLAGISVEAGVDFSIAMERTARLLPEGPVKEGVKRAVEEIKVGKTRREALENMARTFNVKELTDFVSAVVQAERMGTGLLKVVKNFSDELRRKRFEDAEKRAQEIPVKLMLPLLFIFICNFIVILAPIVVRAISGGMVR